MARGKKAADEPVQRLCNGDKAKVASAANPPTAIHTWLGHADLSTTQLYAHFAPGYQAHGIEKIAL